MKGGKGVGEGECGKRGRYGRNTVNVVTKRFSATPISDRGNKIAPPLQISCPECMNSRVHHSQHETSADFRHTESQCLPAGLTGDSSIVGDYVRQ